MEFEIPTVPAAIILLLNFISPYFVDLLNGVKATPTRKKVLATILSFGVSVALIVVALLVGIIPADFSPQGWLFLLLIGLGTQQASFGLFWKDTELQAVARKQ